MNKIIFVIFWSFPKHSFIHSVNQHLMTAYCVFALCVLAPGDSYVVPNLGEIAISR